MTIDCSNGWVYVVKKGDTIFKISQRYGVTIEQILEVNPQITDPDVIKPGQKICIPKMYPPPGTCPGMMYIIKSGDTLYALARRFGVTVDAIKAANPDIDPQNLIIGDKICIPLIPPSLRPKCMVLNPTDNTPESKGFVFIEPDTNSLFVGITNVPEPATLPGGEVYKVWVRRSGTNTYAVGVLDEAVPGYYVTKVVPDFPLSQADTILITSEIAENIMAPQGLGVATGQL